MARTIDERVVSASFETSKFQAGVSSMLNGLDKLKKSMDFKNAGKGLDQINASANKVNLSHIANGVDSISSKLGALRLTAIATFASIATRGLQAGAQFIKQFTFQPVIDGLREYENQINSVQTILANTKSAGTNIGQVNGALNQLNRYADKTIYNFGQMTKNIGTFTAAGVDLNTSVKSIKGISNLAAMSGSSAEQASVAMYQLSQAISSGRVGLQDWNSVVNAGMGGAVFQRALAQTAQAMGKLKDGAVQLKGPMKNVSIEGQSFRESIQARPGKTSWLTSDVLTNTLKQFSGDLNKAQLKAQGFNDAQIKAIQAQAKTALEAATQVKTFSQLVDTTKEAIGSGWASTFQIIFGNFEEAKKLWTGLSGVIGGFVIRQAEARNNMLKAWKANGGRTALIDAVKQGFEDLNKLIGPVAKAFRDIFPRKTGAELAGMTRNLLQFTKALEPSPKTVENLRRTFRGFFAVLDIGKQIVGGIFYVIGQLFGAVGDGSGGFLDLTGNIGDFLVSLDKAIKKGGYLTHFFDTLGSIIATPIVFLQKFAYAMGEVFGAKGIGRATDNLGPLEKIIAGLEKAWDSFLGSIGKTREIAQPALTGLSDLINGLTENIATALQGANFDAIYKVLQVGLLGGIFLTFKKALAGGVLKSIVQAFTGVGGLTRSIGGTFDALTGSIQTMQQNVKSDTLKNIAISIALLSASMVGLSLVDPKRLNSALSAITIGFGELLGAMAIMDKIGKSGGFIKMPVIAASMILLAGAIDILAIAVYSLSKLSWEQLAKGLGAVSVLLISISAAAGPLSANSAGLIRAGAGITIIAVAMNLLARAVSSFGGMDMPTLAKGIGGIAVALAGIGAAANLFPSGMVAIGVGLVAVGAGLKLIAGTVHTLGGLDMSTLAKGIGAIAVALVAIGLAMNLMPGPSMVVTAAGLVLVGVALKSIAKAIGKMGGMSIEQIAKGLGTLAASLALLAIALIAMQSSIGGAAALAVAAAGIAVLAPALKTLGEQSWGQIIKGFVALAAAFGLLGVAGVVLAPVAPAILALGAALIAVGAGLALAGAGVFLIGTGLAAVAVAGPAAVKILVDALVKLAEALPKVIQGLVKALLQLVQSIAKAAPQFVQALGKILAAMAQAIVVSAPQLEKAFIALLELIFMVLRKETPNLVKTGFDMLKALLKGISNNIGGVVKMVGIIVAKFLAAIGSSIGKIITGGAQILAGILKGIANGLSKVVTAAASIMTNFLRGIANNIGKIVTAGGDIIVKFLRGIANNIRQVVTEGGNIIANLIRGIGNAGSKIVSAGVSAASKFVRAVAKGAVKMADEGAKAVIRFLNGVADVIDKREPEMIRAGVRIGVAIVRGMINGIGSLAGELKRKAERLISDLPNKALKILRIKSPSGVFEDIGKNIVLGLSAGISKNSSKALAALTDTVRGMVMTFEKESQNRIAALGDENIRTLYDLGNQVSSSFYQGLMSGIPQADVDPVTQAFSDIVKSIAGTEDTLEQAIVQDTANIKQANKDLKKDWDDLREARKKKDSDAEQSALNSIKTRQAERDAAKDSKKAHEDLLSIMRQAAGFILTDPSLKKWANDLAQTRVNIEALNKDLDEQTQKLNDLQSARQSLFDQTFQKFSSLPAITATDENGNPIDPAVQVQNYINSLSNADDVVGTFTNTLDQLQGMGLNQDTYQQLLDIGPAAQGFADALLSLGPAAIAGLNAADNDLRNAATTLANHGADEMYATGIATAQGLVAGIKVKINDAVKTAEDLAIAIVKAIKNKLKIKSPSQVFAEIGAYSVEGMALGFTNSSKMVTDAVYGVSDEAKASIKKSMRGISDIVSEEINPNPTITPILDLSQIQAGANQIDSIIPSATLSLTSGITVPGTGEDTGKDGQAAPIQFIQNNTSPESLSEIEIYRQTRNQLAQARPVLASP